MKPSFDFVSTNELPYEERDGSKFGSGDNYGIGEPPKIGKMRSTFMKPEKTKTFSLPPRKVG